MSLHTGYQIKSKKKYIWKLAKNNNDTEEGNIGWEMHSGTLIRVAGIYDKRKKIWKKKKSALVAVDVKNIDFLFYTVNGHIKSVAFTITFTSKELIGKSVLRNRGITHKPNINGLYNDD